MHSENMATIALNGAKSPNFVEIVVAENDRCNRFTVSFKAEVILRIHK